MKRIGVVGFEAKTFHSCEPVAVEQTQTVSPNGGWSPAGDGFQAHQAQLVQSPRPPPGRKPLTPLGPSPKFFAAGLDVWGTGDRSSTRAQLQPSWGFTLPDGVVSCARAHGLRAELKNGASLSDVKSMVDQGAQPIVLLDSDGSGKNLRYATVTGYSLDEKRHIASVELTDNSTGLKRRVPVGQMMREWSQPARGEVGTRVLISVVPKGGQQVRGRDGVPRAASDVFLPTRAPSVYALLTLMNRPAEEIANAADIHAGDGES